jgi:hypothetical protein
MATQIVMDYTGDTRHNRSEGCTGGLKGRGSVQGSPFRSGQHLESAKNLAELADFRYWPGPVPAFSSSRHCTSVAV